MYLRGRRRRGSFLRWIVAAALLVFLFGIAGSAAVSLLAGSRSSMLVIAFVGGLVWALIAVGVLAGRFAPAIGRVMDAAGRVAEGDYDSRVPERGPASVRALARSFNTMTERLQSQDRLRRDLMADVAHELRTPLTIMQGTLEGLIDGVYPRDGAHLQQLLEETHVLSRLVEDLRTLALSESGALKLQREPTDIAGLARDVTAGFGAEASARGVTLTTEAHTPISPIDIDPIRIREVIANLVSNALRHTPSGGTVVVRTAEATDGVSIDVHDSGSGMSPDTVAHAFDRFYKGQESRGSGLGLTIARNLVAAHGGTIGAASESGRGTTITFALPRDES